jgi:hypothetical protein
VLPRPKSRRDGFLVYSEMKKKKYIFGQEEKVPGLRRHRRKAHEPVTVDVCGWASRELSEDRRKQ